MLLSKGFAHYAPSDNPTRDAINEVDPTVVIPDSYEGNVRSPFLAKLFVAALNNGATFESLSKPVETKIKRKTAYELFVLNCKRYDIPNADAIFYDIDDVLDLTADEPFYYLLYISYKYKDTMGSVSPTLKQLYNFKEEKGGRDENGLISEDTLEKFFLLNSTLRDEGVMLDTKSIFICSFRWGEKGTLELLLDGMNLQEAVRMYEIGFTTIEEIHEYYSSVPASWRDKIFGTDADVKDENTI